MATKTFLNNLDCADLLKRNIFGFSLSLELERRLLQKLEQGQGFWEAGPIALGSWAMGTLCPGSDIDLLFVGPIEASQCWMRWAQQSGLKVRARTPNDLQNWHRGVEPFDHFALLGARALAASWDEKLKEEQQKIRSSSRLRHGIFRAIQADAKVRRVRTDGGYTVLEPFVKSGTGGLREAMTLKAWSELGFNVGVDGMQLERHLERLLMVRQVLQLRGEHEILRAGIQKAISEQLGFSNHQSFMKTVLESQRNIGAQFDQFILQKTAQAPKSRRGFESWFFRLPRSYDFGFLFRSGWFSRWSPDWSLIEGLVQHDHYHRFSVDAHLVRLLSELHRLYYVKAHLNSLRARAQKLRQREWRVLVWAALYHDLGKGRAQDHSEVGESLVYAPKTQVPRELRDDVAWLVRRHLIFSTAAFRRNPEDVSTWKWLTDQGLTPAKVNLLAVFTALDIMATNPDAWNPWKAQMLTQLAKKMSSSSVDQWQKSYEQMGQLSLAAKSWLMSLDPYLVTSVPARLLQTDYKKLSRKGEEMSPLVYVSKSNAVWIRLHSREDRLGLLSEFVALIYSLGCQIRTASIATDPQYGVYDWFQVRTQSRGRWLEKHLIELWKKGDELGDSKELPRVEVESVESVAAPHDESGLQIISIRGRDQRGFLAAAVHALTAEGLSIRWAKVNTWGRQIDDVFGVERSGLSKENLDQVLGRVRERLGLKA